MPRSTILELAQEEQAQMLAALRRARYGYLLALHILLWCTAGLSPTEIAAVLFCSRSSVYRTVRAYREGTLGLESDAQGGLIPPVRTTVLLPTLRRCKTSSGCGLSPSTTGAVRPTRPQCPGPRRHRPKATCLRPGIDGHHRQYRGEAGGGRGV